jgi:hypothetical protein
MTADKLTQLALIQIREAGPMGISTDSLIPLLKLEGAGEMTDDDFKAALTSMEMDKVIIGRADSLNRNVTRWFITSKGDAALAERGL